MVMSVTPTRCITIACWLCRGRSSSVDCALQSAAANIRTAGNSTKRMLVHGTTLLLRWRILRGESGLADMATRPHGCDVPLGRGTGLKVSSGGTNIPQSTAGPQARVTETDQRQLRQRRDDGRFRKLRRLNSSH